MPAQARGLPDRPFMLGAVVPDSQHCHRPKGWLAHTPHSSHRAAAPADSPQVYLATMALLNHRPCGMIAESGMSAPATPRSLGGWKQPCLQPWRPGQSRRCRLGDRAAGTVVRERRWHLAVARKYPPLA